MAIDALVKPFLSLPLFRGLKPLQITEVVRRADRIIYRAGETLIEEDQAGDAAIVIVSGNVVRMSGDRPDVAEPLAEGSLIGELAMLVETIHTSTVVAKSQVRALRLSRTEMHALMAEDRKLAEHFSAYITSRLKKLAVELRAVDDALARVTEFGQSTELGVSARGALDRTTQSLAVH